MATNAKWILFYTTCKAMNRVIGTWGRQRNPGVIKLRGQRLLVDGLRYTGNRSKETRGGEEMDAVLWLSQIRFLSPWPAGLERFRCAFILLQRSRLTCKLKLLIQMGRGWKKSRETKFLINFHPRFLANPSSMADYFSAPFSRSFAFGGILKNNFMVLYNIISVGNFKVKQFDIWEETWRVSVL